MIKRMCLEPGCSGIAAQGGYCEKHARQGNLSLFEGTRRKGSAAYISLYNTGAWRRMRAAFLKAHPFCAVCGAPATVADHIIPHKGNEALFFDEASLQPLCKACHSRKTLEENGHFRGVTKMGKQES